MSEKSDDLYLPNTVIMRIVKEAVGSLDYLILELLVSR